jgi:urease gamma subunit
MKLHELGAQRRTEQVAKVLESHLDNRVNFDRLNCQQATRMLTRVRGLIREHRATPAFHVSERNPNYIKLVMMEQALVTHVNEMGVNTQQVMAVDINDPKVKTAMQKAQNGQALNPDESKTIGAIAAMKKESAKKKRMVKEASELQQAQVVLAAQDMIDRVQGMLEDVSEMQFKDLPALVNSIKQDMGMEQANQFQSQATTALSQLLTAMQQGKTAMEGAQGVLTGQAPVVPGQPADDELGAMPEPAAGDDLDTELDASFDNAADDLDDEEAAPATLGRERR